MSGGFIRLVGIVDPLKNVGLATPTSDHFSPFSWLVFNLKLEDFTIIFVGNSQNCMKD
ncbi:MAG: hypothetical protein WC536_03685 [Patescibacteria group bacterium]